MSLYSSKELIHGMHLKSSSGKSVCVLNDHAQKAITMHNVRRFLLESSEGVARGCIPDREAVRRMKSLKPTLFHMERQRSFICFKI